MKTVACFCLCGMLIALPPAHAQQPDQGGEPAAPVVVAAVRERVVVERVSLIGTIEPVRESTVAAEVSGIVDVFNVHEGDYVEKGKVLARLRARNLVLRLKGARAARDAIKAKLVLAEKELQRVKNLKLSNSVAAKQYDEAFYNHDALKQELRRSDAEIEHMQYEIRQKDVRAPFAGFVAHAHTQVGEWVQTGGSIVTLLDLNRVIIEVDVPEKNAVKLDRQSRVTVRINSAPDAPAAAVVKRVLPQGDPIARTFPVHIEVPNQEGRLKSGMEAVVTFAVGDEKQVMVVPKDAVVTSGEQRLVYRVVDRQSLPVAVDILGYYDGDAAVQGPLSLNDRVVIRGNERLRPGQPVRIIEQ